MKQCIVHARLDPAPGRISLAEKIERMNKSGWQVTAAFIAEYIRPTIDPIGGIPDLSPQERRRLRDRYVAEIVTLIATKTE